jgi:hypothetical protein
MKESQVQMRNDRSIRRVLLSSHIHVHTNPML